MREFREVLNEAFARHSAALTSHAEAEEPTAIVAEIRRKRGWRTAGFAAGSVLAVSAIAAAAITGPRVISDGFGPAAGAAPDAVTDFAWGPFLLGPESALFACDRPLPRGYDGEPSAIKHHEGTVYREDLGVEFDFGDDGFILMTDHPYYPDPALPPPAYPGWSASGSSDSGEPRGQVTFTALVWVDAQDRIVARQVAVDALADTSRVAVPDHSIMGLSGSTGASLMFVGDVSHMAVPCDGVDAARVDSAQLVIIRGQGAGADAMEWEIFRP